jgi:hypothetical protein
VVEVAEVVEEEMKGVEVVEEEPPEEEVEMERWPWMRLRALQPKMTISKCAKTFRHFKMTRLRPTFSLPIPRKSQSLHNFISLNVSYFYSFNEEEIGVCGADVISNCIFALFILSIV